MFPKTLLSMSCALAIPPRPEGRGFPRDRMKKTLLSLTCAAALLSAAVAPAFASSSFFLVVPIPVRTQEQAPENPITVSLSSATLAKGTVNKAYSESLRPYLSVTGDEAFDSADARWSLVEGFLPAGVTLDETTGALAGMPTTKTESPATFTVQATWKDKNGQAVYTIEVGGQVLHVTQIDSVFGHTCTITAVGALKCWGYNSNGQLGDGTTKDRLTPVQVIGLTSGVLKVATGQRHTCAITETGVQCWGYNASGQLGDGTTLDRLSPVPTRTTVGMNSVVGIKTYLFHTCAVTAAGKSFCWGSNSYGQLGDNTTINRESPTAVTILGAQEIKEVSVGQYHSCAVTNTDDLYCWGRNDRGQLGNGTNTNSRVMGAPIPNISSVSAGGNHTCGINTLGGLHCWGLNSHGQLGIGSTTSQNKPTPVYGLSTGVSRVSAGDLNTCAVTTSGALKCWGANGSKQLGDELSTHLTQPRQVVSSGAVGVTSGTAHTCAILDGFAKCWGANGYGQLGNNSTVNSSVPVTPSLP